MRVYRNNNMFMVSGYSEHNNSQKKYDIHALKFHYKADSYTNTFLKNVHNFVTHTNNSTSKISLNSNTVQQLNAYRIAAKISRGEYVSNKEKHQLASTSLELSQKASMVNYRRKGLEIRLKTMNKADVKSTIQNQRITALSWKDIVTYSLYCEGLSKTARKFYLNA